MRKYGIKIELTQETNPKMKNRQPVISRALQQLCAEELVVFAIRCVVIGQYLWKFYKSIPTLTKIKKINRRRVLYDKIFKGILDNILFQKFFAIVFSVYTLVYTNAFKTTRNAQKQTQKIKYAQYSPPVLGGVPNEGGG